MTFLSSEKKLQTAWKLQTHTLPRLAKAPGLYRSKLYPFCLPLEFAAYNLFSEIRDEALDTFDRLGIVWHSSALQGLCSNHLCSSQVFAVNFLFPFVHRPDALAELLKPHFPDLARMLPIEGESFIAFEWIGEYNYLGESPKLGSDRRRGAGNTSIDAAMMYEATDGRRIMLLCEFKYSESYGVSYKRFRSDGTDRVAGYRDFYYAGNSPIDITIVPKIENHLYEPFYQLLRQQLLATQIVETGIPDVDRVLVVHLYTKANRELTAVTSPALRQFGRDAYEVWRHILVDPASFVPLPVEELFKSVPLDRFPELEPWALYLSQRYSFLK
jgi:hypothetical protein